MKHTREQKIWLSLLLFSSLTGISIWYVRRLIEQPISDWISSTIYTFSWFTNLTNLLVVVMAVFLLFGRGKLHDWFAKWSVQSAICLYIAFVGLAFWGLLGGPGELNTFFDYWPEITAHSLSPILGAVYFFRIIPNGALTWMQPVKWLIYPVGYLAYWLLRGPLVGYYPYFFVDVDDLGYGGVAVWTLVLIAAFLILGTLMVLAKRRRKG